MFMLDMLDDKQRYAAKLMLYQAGIKDCDCPEQCNCLVLVAAGMTVEETVITTENATYRLVTNRKEICSDGLTGVAGTPS